MTKDETRQVIKIINAIWPNFQKDAGDLSLVLDLWSAALANTSLKDAQKALEALALTQKFPPAIAEVVEAAKQHGQKQDIVPDGWTAPKYLETKARWQNQMPECSVVERRLTNAHYD